MESSTLFKKIKLITNNQYILKKILTDLLIITIIILLGIKFAFRLEDGLDIRLYDESSYLFSGVKLVKEGLPSPDFAPLYAIWYFILSLIEPNRVNLYYLNFKLMVIVPPTLLYILLRKNKLSFTSSAIISWFFLVSTVNANTIPKVSHFALILILGILIMASRQSFIWTSYYCSIGSLLVAFVRPEFFVSYILSLIIFIAAIIFGKNARIQAKYLIGYILLSVFLILVFGIPFSGTRSFIAFGQHFAKNWVKWNGIDLNPWTNWKEIISQTFGSAQSIIGALVQNPSMFLRHIIFNLTNILKISPNLVLPDFFPNDLISKILAIISLIVLGILNLANIQKRFKEVRFLILFIGILILPGFISTIIILPRDHYLILIIVLITISVAILVGKESSGQLDVDHRQIVLLGLFAITITPYFANPRSLNLPQPIKDTILFIESLDIKEQVNLLETEGGYAYYLGENYQRIKESDKDTNFFQFLIEQDINMIVLTEKLSNDNRFRDDTEWHDFLTNLSDYKFIQLEIPHTDKKLLIQSNISH